MAKLYSGARLLASCTHTHSRDDASNSLSVLRRYITASHSHQKWWGVVTAEGGVTNKSMVLSDPLTEGGLSHLTDALASESLDTVAFYTARAAPVVYLYCLVLR